MDEDAFWTALHELAGLCGHCGKKRCPGRKSHSNLPDRLSLEDVTSAVAAALKADQPPTTAPKGGS